MLKRISSFVLVCSCLMVAFSNSASAERYVIRAYHAPVVVRPVVVAAPVSHIQIVPRRVLRPGYYTPAPVVVIPRPVVAAPVLVTPVTANPISIVVSPRRRVHEVVRGNGNRTAVRVREYRRHGIFPTAKHVVIQRDTRRGVVVRQRGR